MKIEVSQEECYDILEYVIAAANDGYGISRRHIPLVEKLLGNLPDDELGKDRASDVRYYVNEENN